MDNLDKLANAEIAAALKDADDKQALVKLEFMMREYWRLRNDKARYMRCPYCTPNMVLRDMKHNWPGRSFCCFTFGKALKAILDRQDQVDVAYKAAQTATKLIKMVEN